MKKALFIFTLTTVTMLSCSENDEFIAPQVTGEWRLIESLVDPGDGSGTFHEVISDKIIRFHNDGTYASNGSTCFMGTSSDRSSTGTFDSETRRLYPDGCNVYPEGMYVSYQFEGSALILYYPCIEACAQKYSKLDSPGPF